jgi:uncharacterized protein YkwD
MISSVTMRRQLTRVVRSRLVFLIAASSVMAAGCASAPVASTARTTTTPSTRPTTRRPPAAPAGFKTSEIADEVLLRTNAARRSAGLPALERSVNLMSAAQLQADQMSQTGTMAHDLPGTAYPTLKTRLAAVSYNMRAAGENIAEGQRDAAEALDTWMNSAGHRSNILSSDYTELGTGVALGRNGRLYFVQVFGRPARTAAPVKRPG